MSEATAPVQLARLHGADARGARGRPLGRLHGITLLIHPGVHAFIGHAEDGSVALAEILAGRRKPRVGSVLVLGREPWRSAPIRARIGSLLDQPDLPPSGSVGQAVAWVGRLRGQRSFDPLERWGLSPWGGRALASLRRDEARAIELALAMSTPEPVALVLYEPFRDVAGIDQGLLRRELSQHAAGGCSVLLLSDSMLGIDSVADQLHHLQRGRLVAEGDATGWPELVGGELLLWLESHERDAAIRLVTALGERAELDAVGWRQHGDHGALVVSVRAGDLQRAALAIAETVSQSGVGVTALQGSGVEATLAATTEAPP